MSWARSRRGGRALCLVAAGLIVAHGLYLIIV
jgi:hypothetical protein